MGNVRRGRVFSRGSQRPRRARRSGWLLGFAALALLAAACSKPAPSHDYALRGVVRQLPVPGDPASGFYLHHEAIDGFVDREGRASGMESMTMPFELAKGVSLDGVAVGDPVEVQLHVDWAADLPVAVTALRELPAATELQLGAAQPDKP